jgi:hypothetical protein
VAFFAGADFFFVGMVYTLSLNLGDDPRCPVRLRLFIGFSQR